MKHKVFLAGILSMMLVFGLVFIGCKSNSVQEDAPRQSAPVNSTQPIIEEDIDLGEPFGILKYYLSNNSTEIERVILSETGKSIDLGKVRWGFNEGFSENVQDVMNKRNVNYSMTLVEGDTPYFIVNRRFNSSWFYYLEGL